MDLKLVREAFEAANTELSELDAELARLHDRRKALVEYVRATRVLLNAQDTGTPKDPEGTLLPRDLAGLAAPPSTVPPPPPLPRGSEAGLDAKAATQRRSERRKYLQRLVDMSVEALRRAGRPMNIDEIYAIHPERLNVTRKLLYHTVYKRQNEGRQLSFDRGYFWILGEDLPPGWVHPLPPGAAHVGRPKKK